MWTVSRVAEKKDEGRDCDVVHLWVKMEPSPTAGDPGPEPDAGMRL
jgi:hypothetical protein